ncbi:hypothetical protein QAD02_004955 [Eretmocerus hayati]|uniref:Uncharacterized protein n=1 Tax=Eretmocerus hayati TaxID=131215 RepID=A0ACC2NS50_9HYME|nr:hypothetical protein QAD02_004955 [Eretmocerus hayati]
MDRIKTKISNLVMAISSNNILDIVDGSDETGVPGCSFWPRRDVNQNLPNEYSATPKAVWPNEHPKIPTTANQQKDFMNIFMGRKGHAFRRTEEWRELIVKCKHAQGVYYENKETRMWRCIYHRPGKSDGWEMVIEHQVGLAEIYEHPEPCAFNDGKGKICNETPLELTDARQCVFCCLTLSSNMEIIAGGVPVISEVVKKET